MTILPFMHWVTQGCFFLINLVWHQFWSVIANSEIPSSLTVDTQDVFNALNGFSGSSSRILGFRAQHLLDAMCEYAAPTTQGYSQTYTSWSMNYYTAHWKTQRFIFSYANGDLFVFPCAGRLHWSNPFNPWNFCSLCSTDLNNGTRSLRCSFCIKKNLWDPVLAYISTRISINFNLLTYWWPIVHRLSVWHLQQGAACYASIFLSIMGH